jgi:DNA repair exonuclease SbcCD ATPase subunit
MIRNVKSRGFKGSTRIQQLSAMNLIIGNNASTKSALVEAIEIAITGEHHIVGKQNKALYLFASEPTMSVGVDFENGESINRIYTEGKSISCKVEGEYLADEGLKIMLNPSLWFGATEKDRMQMVFNLIGFGSSELSLSSIRDTLSSATLAFNEPKLTEQISSFVFDNFGDESATLPSCIDTLEKALREKLREIKAAQKRMAATAENLTGLSFVESQLSSLPEPQAIKDEITRSAAQIEQLVELIAVARETVRIAANEAVQVVNLKKELAELKDGADVERENKEIDLRASYTKISKEFKDSTAAVLKLQVAASRVEAEGKIIYDQKQQERSEEARALSDQLNEKKADLLAFDKSTFRSSDVEKPPTGVPIEIKGQAMFKLDNIFNTVIDQIKYPIEWRCLELSSQDRAARSMLRESIEGMVEELYHLEVNEAFNPSHYIDEKFAENYHKQQLMNKQLQGRLNDVSGELQMLSPRIDTNARRELLNASIQALITKGVETDMPELGNMMATLESRRSSHLEIKAQATNVEALLQDKKRIQECEGFSKDYALKVKAYKAALDKLLGIRADAVSESIEPVIDIANNMTANLFEDSAKIELVDGKLGRILDGKFIEWQVFSGSEKAALFIGLAAGIASRSSFKLLILDELSYFDDTRKEIMLNNIGNALERGDIDQAIAIDVRHPTFDLAIDLNLIEV